MHDLMKIGRGGGRAGGRKPEVSIEKLQADALPPS